MKINKVNIEVTEDDIAHGLPHDPSCCPVAKALARAMPGAMVSVGCAYLSVYRPETRNPPFYAGLPFEAMRFIRRFDGGKEVQPFAFTVSIEESSP